MVYKQSVDKTTDQIMKVLRTIYGASIPNPINVHIPDWWVNPLYQGMYTVPPSGFGKDEFEVLAMPVGRLHLVSQATPSTPQHWMYCITGTQRKGLVHMPYSTCAAACYSHVHSYVIHIIIFFATDNYSAKEMANPPRSSRLAE